MPWATIRLVVDVTIISFLIHTIFISVRKFYLSYHVVGLSMLVGIYVLSTMYHLPMTHAVFSFIADISLLIFVIVFQKEIKKFIEMLPAYFVKLVIPVKNEPVVDEIMEAIRSMSSRNIGALLIFTGQESIYRYCLRKVSLHGRISRQLLISLFEKSSPTHDGGVIINGTVIESFGAVFSLVERMPQNKRGTRHHAAIELSTKTDALIVIVSEENGKVSYARKGKVYRPSQEDLRRQIEQFSYSNALHRNYIMERLRSELVYFFVIWTLVLAYRLYGH